MDCAYGLMESSVSPGTVAQGEGLPPVAVRPFLSLNDGLTVKDGLLVPLTDSYRIPWHAMAIPDSASPFRCAWGAHSRRAPEAFPTSPHAVCTLPAQDAPRGWPGLAPNTLIEYYEVIIEPVRLEKEHKTLNPNP